MIRIRRRRAFILIAVLVVVTSSLLVATGLLFLTQAELASASGSEEQVQSRLLGWSGVLAVTEQLKQQRDRILEGEAATLEREMVLYEANGREGVVRLLSVTPGGELLSPEAGRLDLNRVTATMLADTGLVDFGLARSIVAHRDDVLDGSFQSVVELLGVPGVGVELLYGPLEDMRLQDEALGAVNDLGDRVSARLGGDSARGLADIVTVYAVEPALQRSGRLRINLNVPWSDELGERIDERFGEGASRGLKDLFDAGITFESDAAIYQVLNRLNIPPDGWSEIIDTLTADDGNYHYGRLDINTASLEALAALEAIDEEQAARIVRAREALPPDTLATVAWLATEGIVEPEAYDLLGGHITTRSWTYRMRLAAGERAADGGGTDDAAIDNPVIYEVVIDLSDPEPRVAYLRDVTLLDTAALVALHADAYADDRWDDPPDESTDEIDPVDDGPDDRTDDRPLGGTPVTADTDASVDDDENGPGNDPENEDMDTEDAPDGSPSGTDSPSDTPPGTSPDGTRNGSTNPPPAPPPEDRRVGRWRRGR